MKQKILNGCISSAWIVIPFLLFLVFRLIGYNGLYGQDAFEYLRYTHVIGMFFRNGTLPGHFPWPPVYPALGAIAGLIIPETYALQIISLVSFGVSIRLMELILGLLYPEKRSDSRRFLILFYALSPFVIRYSTTVMSDGLALCFSLASLYFTLLFKATSKPRHFLLLSFFLFLAVNTRFSSAVILAIPVFYALRHFVHRFNIWYFILTIAAVTIIFAPNILLDLKNPIAIHNQYLAMSWRPAHIFSNTFLNVDGISAYFFPNILFIFSNLVNPGFIFPGLLFLVFFIRNLNIKNSWGPWMTAYLLYSVFIGFFPVQNARYLLFSFPVVLVIYYESWMKLTSLVRKLKNMVIITFLIILVQVGLIIRAEQPFIENCWITREVALQVGHYPGRKVYEFNIAMAFPAYGVTNPSENLWSRKIDRFDTGALVVFNYRETEERWKGLNPMLNWETLKSGYRLALLHPMDYGWNIYEIKP